MPIDAETQDALDVLDERITNLRQLAITSFSGLDGRMDELDKAQQRLRRSMRDGSFDGEAGTFVDALASALGLSAVELRAALVWVTQERRKARG